MEERSAVGGGVNRRQGPRRAVVLGIGNLLLRDEGVGALAAQELERRYLLPHGLEVLDGGTAGIELMRHIACKDLLVIIDAVKSGREPGSLMRLEGEAVPAAFRQRISPHQIGLADLLATTMLMGEMPDQVVLFGVEPLSMDTGLGLSGPVSETFERLLVQVVAELAREGFVLVERAVADWPAPSVLAVG